LIRIYPDRRAVDNFILGLAGSGPRTAIIFPPIIFGTGSGPVNQRSIQVPSIAKNALQEKQAVYVGQGLSRWGAIHIADLAQLFVKLVEKAVNGGNDDFWDENGLYFAESGEEVCSHVQASVPTVR
jgi:nucleoside-diphosphate-sugar epimerase